MEQLALIEKQKAEREAAKMGTEQQLKVLEAEMESLKAAQAAADAQRDEASTDAKAKADANLKRRQEMRKKQRELKKKAEEDEKAIKEQHEKQVAELAARQEDFVQQVTLEAFAADLSQEDAEAATLVLLQQKHDAQNRKLLAQLELEHATREAKAKAEVMANRDKAEKELREGLAKKDRQELGEDAYAAALKEMEDAIAEETRQAEQKLHQLHAELQTQYERQAQDLSAASEARWQEAQKVQDESKRLFEERLARDREDAQMALDAEKEAMDADFQRQLEGEIDAMVSREKARLDEMQTKMQAERDRLLAAHDARKAKSGGKEELTDAKK